MAIKLAVIRGEAMTPKTFVATLKEHQIDVSQKQLDQFEIYFERLVATNQNLI